MRLAGCPPNRSKGTPTEQCALLVYLLRQAGINATYVFPQKDQMLLLDQRVSRLMGSQIRGARGWAGYNQGTPTFVPVNYPWVAAQINGSWVHVFPWLKDVEIIEGLDLRDVLPAQYPNLHNWLVDYVHGKPELLGLSPENSAGTLFPLWLEKHLRENVPGLTLDDVGARRRVRRQLISQWSDLPRPNLVQGSVIPVESLGSSEILRAGPTMGAVFDTLSVEVSSDVTPAKKVGSGELRLAELHNRRFLLRHEKVNATTHNMILSLAPYRDGLTGSVGFGSVSLGSNSTNALYNLTAVQALAAADDKLTMKLVLRRHRQLLNWSDWTNSIILSSPLMYANDVNYLGVASALETGLNRPLRKGDMAALCVNSGRVTKPMLQVHADEYWKMERTVAATPSAASGYSADLYQGGIAYLLGMSYYERVSDMSARLRDLTKTHVGSQLAMGLAKISPRRDAGGNLPNGDIIPVFPNVDMFFLTSTLVGNTTLHQDSGNDGYGPFDDWFAFLGIGASALEHETINQFFRQEDGVSTVRLLQLAQAAATASTPGPVWVNRLNYQTLGDTPYPTATGTLLKNHDMGIWKSVTNGFGYAYASYRQAYLTPGAMTNRTGSFKGMAALVLSRGEILAAIGSQNGGYGEWVPDPTFNSVNIPNVDLGVDAGGYFYFDYTPSTPSTKGLASENLTPWNIAGQANQLTLNQDYLADTMNSRLTLNRATLGLPDTMTTGDQLLQEENRGVVPKKWYEQLGEFVSDPVSVVTGEFYVDTTDLVLPGPMPLKVRRNYSSQSLAENGLGYGWKLSYMPFLSVALDGKVIYGAEANGTVVAYRQTTTNVNVWLPSLGDNPRMENDEGSVANLLNARLVKSVAGGTNYFTLSGVDGSTRVFSERSFSLGTTLNRTRPYLETWTDSRGNSYTFTHGTVSTDNDYGQVRRIESSNGSFLGFNYNVFGQIIEVYASDGRRLRYDYDQYGDLVKVRFPDASEVQYEYQRQLFATNGVAETYSTHLLFRERKPEGRVLENEYDAERRVINQSATAGTDNRLVHNATFIYNHNYAFATDQTNKVTGHTLVVDFRKNVTRYDYTDGLITKITDPLNQAEEQTWHAVTDTTPPKYPRALWKRKDKRGVQTEFQYDAVGNITNSLVSVTVGAAGALTGDLTGDGITTVSTSAKYAPNNLPTETVDAAGNTLKFFYLTTNAWMLERVEKYAGATLVGTTDYAYTNVVTTTNRAYGLRAVEIRSGGATNVWTYDGRGYHVGSIRYARTTENPSISDPPVTLALTHNDRGELIRQVNAANHRTDVAYDAMGRPKWREVFDENGNALGREYSYYNDLGEPTWSDGPRYNPEDYVFRDYDGAGRLVTETRWRSRAKTAGTGVEPVPGDDLYATTQRFYDLMGNELRMVDARGDFVLKGYDSLDRLTNVIAYGGSAPTVPLKSESLGYEPGGQVRAHTNAINAVTLKFYTSSGLLARQENPDGSTNKWTYYADGRPKREYLVNDSYWETTYDDALRKVTRRFKDRLDTLLATEVREFDARGNLTKLTDATGAVFITTYDGLDRVKTTTGPAATGSSAQQTTTFTYDASGKVTKAVNALGQETVTETDALGRTVKSEIKATAGGTVVRSTSTAYAPDHHSVTVTSGTGGGAVTTVSFTDTFGNPVLTQFNPTNQFTLQTYDRAGALLSSRDELGQTSTFGYDGLGRQVWRALPDGATNRLTYDAVGNVTTNEFPNGMRWLALYDTKGRMRTNWLVNGATATRTNTVTYKTAGAIGLVDTTTDGRGITFTHAYDAWLRLTNRAAGSFALGYELDLLGRTRAIQQTAGGQVSRVDRVFDSYGQPTLETVTLGGATFSQFGQQWDGAGRRTSRYQAANPLVQGLGYGDAAAFAWRADGLLASTTQGSLTATYGYTNNGLVIGRTNAWRHWTATQRDARGRLQQASTKVNGSSVLAETLNWRSDSKLDDYTADRTGAGTWDETKDYSYNSRGQLTGETFKPWAAGSATYTFGYDAAKLGVRTTANLSGSLANTWAGGTPDGLGRLTGETVTQSQWFLTARGRAPGALSVALTLDGTAQGVSYSAGNADGLWEAPLNFGTSPSPHTLVATATHPFNGATNALAKTTNTFTASGSGTVTVTYDHNGNVTNRTWSGTNAKAQALEWDELGRLVRVTEKAGTATNLVWSALYDGLSRRLRVTEVRYSGTNTGTSVIESWFDPQVEFLEAAVSHNGERWWQVHGPDLGGAYGAAQGIGGLEGAIRERDGASEGLLSDNFGHAVATVSGTAVTWNATQLSGYGLVQGYDAPKLSYNVSPMRAALYRGRRTDATGFVAFGLRPYDPLEGRFLAPDPLGHAAAWSLYDYAGNDPVNGLDPDGRLARGFAHGFQSDQSTVAGSSGTFEVGNAVGSTLHGYYEGLFGGAEVTANTLTFGGTDYAGLTDSGQYQGPEYTGTRILATAGRELLITAGTLGSAQAFRATGQLGYGALAAAGEGYSTYQNVGAVVEGMERLADGNGWGAVQAGLGAFGLRGNLAAADDLFAGAQSVWGQAAGGGAQKIVSAGADDVLDPLVARQMGPRILENPVAEATYRQMQRAGADLTLDFANAPRTASGALIAGEGGLNGATVFMKNNFSPSQAVSTFVHEGRHAVMSLRGIRQGTQWQEFMARGREFIFQNGRRPAALERSQIWQEMLAHPDYQSMPFR